MTRPVQHRKLTPFEVEQIFPPSPTLTSRVWDLWSKVPAVNLSYPLQLFNTGFQRIVSYLDPGGAAPSLVDQGFSYEEAGAIRRLETKGTMIGSKALHMWFEYVARTCGKNVEWIREPSVNTDPNSLENVIFQRLEKIREKHCIQFIAIPVIVEGLFELHVTHILIELRGKNHPLVEFFDSFGGSLDDEKYKNASIVWNAVIRFFEKVDVFNHKTKLQRDRHNCGITVGWHFEQRVSCDIRPEGIADLQPNFETVRREMILKLIHDRTAKRLSTNNAF